MPRARAPPRAQLGLLGRPEVDLRGPAKLIPGEAHACVKPPPAPRALRSHFIALYI